MVLGMESEAVCEVVDEGCELTNQKLEPLWINSWNAPPGLLFFFQAEDGIRDLTVTGVQTCALPISQRLLDLFGKEALPLELVQRPIDLRVAARLDDHELGGHAGPRERGLHPLGLPQGEPAPAGPELERAGHVSRFPLPASRSKCRTIALTSPGTV